MYRFIHFVASLMDILNKLKEMLHLTPNLLKYGLITHLEIKSETSLNDFPKLFLEPILPLSTKLTCNTEPSTPILKSVVVELLDDHYE